MSKGSEFWGNASGKLGQQVLYRAGGEQRARMHVAKIKNPRTVAHWKKICYTILRKGKKFPLATAKRKAFSRHKKE